MLAAGIDSHITQQMNLIHTQFPVISCNTEAIGLRAPKNHKFSVRKFYFFIGQTRFGIYVFFLFVLNSLCICLLSDFVFALLFISKTLSFCTYRELL